MKLISQGSGEYLSEDGSVKVYRDDTCETTCDDPHPVRMRLNEFKRFYTPERAQEAVDKKVANGATIKSRKTKAGWVEYISWYCDGGESHYYSQWTSSVDGEWTEFVTDTFGETIGSLESLLDEKITVVHPRKEKLAEEQAEYDAGFELIATLKDELRGIEEALARYDELMASDDAPFVDQNLHAFHLRRKDELEALLA